MRQNICDFCDKMTITTFNGQLYKCAYEYTYKLGIIGVRWSRRWRSAEVDMGITEPMSKAQGPWTMDMTFSTYLDGCHAGVGPGGCASSSSKSQL